MRTDQHIVSYVFGIFCAYLIKTRPKAYLGGRVGELVIWLLTCVQYRIIPILVRTLLDHRLSHLIRRVTDIPGFGQNIIPQWLLLAYLCLCYWKGWSVSYSSAS